jgi:hypothetical protein
LGGILEARASRVFANALDDQPDTLGDEIKIDWWHYILMIGEFGCHDGLRSLVFGLGPWIFGPW